MLRQPLAREDARGGKAATNPTPILTPTPTPTLTLTLTLTLPNPNRNPNRNANPNPNPDPDPNQAAKRLRAGLTELVAGGVDLTSGDKF